MSRFASAARRFDRSLPLALKVAVPVVAITVLAAALLGAIGVEEARHQIDETYAAQAKGFSQVLVNQQRTDPSNLQAANAYLIEFARTHPSVDRVQVIQRSSGGPIIWASTQASDVGVPFDPAQLPPEGAGIASHRQISLDGVERYQYVDPIREIDGHPGAITYYFSEDQRDASLSRFTQRIALAALVILLVQLLALSLAMYAVVLRRTKRLERAAAAVAQGDLDVRLPEGTQGTARDELTNVAREFDHMIAAFRMAYEKELDTTERLRELDEAKSTLLHAVSHDLRGPLTSVLGSAMTLQNPAISDEDRVELQKGVIHSAQKMNRLVSDLLDLDRLDKGIVTPDRHPTDLGALVRRVVDEFGGATSRVEIDCPSGVVVALDGPKVERIVDNLLANTVRHTPRDAHVWIRMAAMPGGALLSVEDDGPGVPEELRDVIFQPFRQGGNPGAGGAGIGLSLVDRFARLHGGRAWVEDRPGGGAAFRVELPAENPGEHPTERREEAPADK